MATSIRESCKSCRKRLDSALLDFFKHAWMSGKRRKFDIVKEIGPLNRDFGTVDATLMGLASCLSYFFYTSVIEEIRNFGPLMCAAFIIGSIISTLTVLCFAELTAKAPVMGSTYHYAYRYIGEFAGFMVGWSGMFSLFIKCSAMTRGCSRLLDVLFFDNTISKLEQKHLELPKIAPCVRRFPDMITFLIATAFSGTVSAKPKESKIANNFVTVINICALTTMIILFCGQTKINKLGLDSNIALDEPMSIFPAITIALSYLNGIESIALLGDELKEAHIALPKSFFFSLATCCFYYIGLTLLFSMVMSDYVADVNINSWISLLDKLNLTEVSWIIKIGSMCAFYGGIFTHLFWLTRLVHAMARDGLLFHVFSKIAHTSGVPVTTAFTGGLLTGVFTTFFRTHCMIQTEVFCALLMNVTAPICLLISRYSDGTGGEEIYVGHRLIFINHPQVDNPTVVTEQISIVLISVIISLALISHIGMRFTDEKENTNLARTLFIFVLIIFFIALYCLCRQPQHKSPFYQIPCVPIMPCLNILSIFIIQEYLLYKVWKLLLSYVLIGTIFYFSYSMHKSTEDYLYGRGKWYILNNRTRLPQPKEYEPSKMGPTLYKKILRHRLR
ncbi:cationic amino acid transporter 2-like isoform X2 [Rhodnius prolixus]|uniref:cationic amino acid transporter 2-like isoform X2 n=1 Tax=Rhodnius prolixus TaxID=13249 RepID=UPI003D18D454